MQSFYSTLLTKKYEQSSYLIKPKKQSKQNRQNKSKVNNQIKRNFGNDLTNCLSNVNLKVLNLLQNINGVAIKKNKQFFKTSQNQQLFSQVQPKQKIQLYSNQIYRYLKEIEHKFQIKPNFIINQPQINEKMRSILIDWLVDVHQKFKLLSDTLHLCVHIIDKYLSKIKIDKTKFQLLGIGSLLIASKCQQIYVPQLKDLVYNCANSYNKNQIIQMQGFILSNLEFNLTYTNPLRFLENEFQKYLNLNKSVKNYAKFLIDLSLLNSEMSKFKPSYIAEAAIFLSFKIFNMNCQLIEQEELQRCIIELHKSILSESNSNLTAVRRKYAQQKYGKISQIYIAYLD